MGDFKPENPELWEICMKHGAILAKREKVTQVAILDLYDEVLKLTLSNSDYAKCTKEVLKYIRYSIDSQAGRDVRDIIKKHFA